MPISGSWGRQVHCFNARDSSCSACVGVNAVPTGASQSSCSKDLLFSLFNSCSSFYNLRLEQGFVQLYHPLVAHM